MSVTYPSGDARQPSVLGRKRGPANAKKKGFDALNRIWAIIRDCVDGEQAIKLKRDRYLPIPNAEDESDENQARYDSYIERAVFYNVTRRTLSGLVGQVFGRDPIIEVPTQLEPVRDDATGLGVPLTQLAKVATKLVIAHGRAGVFVDYPQTDGVVSQADLAAGNIRPFLRVYEPWNLINWRVEPRGGKRVLTLVVIQEEYVKSDDGFMEVCGVQWRVLWLNGGVYQMDIYRDTGAMSVIETTVPQDADGKTFDELPFMFIGAEKNDPDPDAAPLYDMASLNIAHYRNSADYEESCFITGQPTPYFTGLNEAWVANVLKGKILLGARAAVPLPVGATAGLLQVAGNTLPFEAMGQKERQMVALGAKLVEQAMVQRTATEASLDRADETSTLSAAADNVSTAFQFALQIAARFVGTDKTGIKFELNTEFDLIKMLPAERLQLIAEWVSGAISWTEMRDNMRRGGIASQTDEVAKADIKENPPPPLTVPGLPAVKPNASAPSAPADPNQPTKSQGAKTNVTGP